MNKTLVAVLILATLPLIGCGMSEITPADVEIEDSRAKARTACVEAKARAEEARMRAISKLPEGQQGMAIMGDAMARQSESLSGKDPCGQGMGAYDIRAIEVKEKNATARSGIKSAASGSAILYGIDRAADIAEKGIEQAGDKIDQKATEGSSITYTQERVTSNADISNRALGEGSNAQTTAPSVSGPDKSSHTTIEAPEEPKVEEPEVEEPTEQTTWVEEPATTLPAEVTE